MKPLVSSVSLGLSLAVLLATPIVHAADCVTTFDMSCLSEDSVQSLAREAVSEEAEAALNRNVNAEEQGAFDEFANALDTRQERLDEEAAALEEEFGPAGIAGIHSQRLKANDAKRMVEGGQHEQLLGIMNDHIEERDDFIRSMELD